jgi:hypothetical protein
MNHRIAFVAVLAPLAFAAGSGFSQTAQQPAPAAPQSNAAPVPYVLTMGDMMNTLVQPRHLKLGLAGKAENWPLAGYALVEIRQAFAGIAKAQPRFRGMPVPDLVEAAMKEPLAAVEAAIRQKESDKFAPAYAQLATGCNACHAALDHPYVVIKTPDASAFPNQDFEVRR